MTYDPSTLASAFARLVEHEPSAPIVVSSSRRVSRADVAALAQAGDVAVRGAEPGALIGLSVPNGPALLALQLIDTELDHDKIMDDLRRRMEGLDRLFPGTPHWPASPPSPLERVEKLFAPKSDPTAPRTEPKPAPAP